MRSFLGEPFSVAVNVGARGGFSGEGDGRLTMLPAPGRSASPVRAACVGEDAFGGEPPLGAKVGMPEFGRAVITTSSAPRELLLFGRTSAPSSAFEAPGEFSLRKDDGSRERTGSLVGEPNLPLPPFDEGVDGTGEFGKDLSSSRGAASGRRADGGENGGDFC